MPIAPWAWFNVNVGGASARRFRLDAPFKRLFTATLANVVLFWRGGGSYHHNK